MPRRMGSPLSGMAMSFVRSIIRLPPALQHALDVFVQEYTLIEAQGVEKLHLAVTQRTEKYRFSTSGACNLNTVEYCTHHERCGAVGRLFVPSW